MTDAELAQTRLKAALRALQNIVDLGDGRLNGHVTWMIADEAITNDADLVAMPGVAERVAGEHKTPRINASEQPAAPTEITDARLVGVSIDRTPIYPEQGSARLVQTMQTLKVWTEANGSEHSLIEVTEYPASPRGDGKLASRDAQ